MREARRDRSAGRWLARLGRELGEAMRLLARRPGTALVAVSTLAVGMAALAMVLGIADALFLAPLAGVREPARLVRVTSPTGPSSVPNLLEVRAGARTLDGVALYVDQLVTLGEDAAAERVLAVLADEHYFPVLGVPLARGRAWTAAEAAAGAPLVVLGHDLWRRRFAADPAVVGRRVVVQGEPFTVVGVAAPGFVGTFRGFRFETWLPLATAERLAGMDLADRGADRLEVVGRLAPGATAEAAAAEVAAIGQRLAAAHPAANAGLELATGPVTGLDDELRGPALALVGLLVALAGVVLALTVANVAGVLLARLLARRGELAVRAALGASARNLGRLLLWEALVLAVAAAALGVPAAVLGGRLLVRSLDDLPVRLALELVPGPRLLLLVAAVAILVAGLLGVPAIAALTRGGLAGGLRPAAQARGGAGGGRARALLVVVQVAAATLLLLAGAGLWRGLQQARGAEDPRLDSVLAAPFLDLQAARLAPGERAARQREVVAAAAALPGVARAALASRPPLPGGAVAELFPAEAPREPGRRGVPAHVAGVTDDYFATVGIALRRGRVWDAAAADGAVVDAAVAARLWPGQSPLGRRLRVAGEEGAELTVVGVSEGLPGAAGEPRPTVYRPLDPAAARFALLVRARPGAGEGLPAAARETLREKVPALSPVTLQPLAELRAVALLPQRLAAGAGGLLGSVGLFVAAAGLYGLLSLLLAQATRELAVRAALGASPASLLRAIAGRAALLAGCGFAAGAGLLAAGAGRLGGLLAGGIDPAAVATVGAVVVVATVLAAALPAWRASRVDPAQTLRSH